MTLMGSARCR